MSYSLNDNCYSCERRKEGCTDVEKIREAVNKIHQDPEHSKKGGSGMILVSCGKCKSTSE